MYKRQGSDHDDTPKSAACPHAEGATRSGGESLRYKNGGAKLPKAVLRLFVRDVYKRQISPSCKVAGSTDRTRIRSPALKSVALMESDRTIYIL